MHKHEFCKPALGVTAGIVEDDTIGAVVANVHYWNITFSIWKTRLFQKYVTIVFYTFRGPTPFFEKTCMK